MALNKILILLILFSASGLVFAEVYQWTDEEGTTHFSDKPVNGAAKKVDIDVLPKHEKVKPNSASAEAKNNEENTQTNNDNTETTETKKEVKKETKEEKAKRSREELTDELIKAREIREENRKKLKEEEEIQIIKCQEEKTKLALMKNELKDYDKLLKTMSRSDRPKSNAYIKWSDLNTRIERQKDITHELCN
ncbi:hypothetical protein MNBD_GAMMA21-1675 [hydrothermal vent metagenome]|uniref:DUF4124 domain-containing protein n=1 Tax=hydrothermal vent metagenome TaxID=652676 RepID=A0A3B1ADE9_9ZZZZ